MNTSRLTLKTTVDVEADIKSVLRRVHEITSQIGIEYFLAGAFARDLILGHVYGIDTWRGTRDIDFAIAVKDWAQFHMLRNALLALPNVKETPKCIHRLLYELENGRKIPIDVIPFGGVANNDGLILWPLSDAMVFNVAGFDEALASSIQVQLEDDLVVHVASIPGLVLLKFFAWEDRRKTSDKDAIDIFRLLKSYGDAGNEERLYNDRPDLLEDMAFDVEVAGAKLLGQDTLRICGELTKAKLLMILSSPDLRRVLLDQIRTSDLSVHSKGRAERLVEAFADGFNIEHKPAL